MKVAILTSFIPPYNLPLFGLLHRSVEDLRIFISTPMEGNRAWVADWGTLPVVVQASLTFRRRWRHPAGFSEVLYTHIPLDTVWQLAKFGPDVVVSTEMGARSLGAVAYGAMRRKTRILLRLNLSERTERGRSRLQTLFRRWILRRANGVFVNGESGKRYLAGLGVDPTSVYRLTYPTDMVTFGGLPLSRPEESAKRLLYVGQVVPRKGILEFIAGLVRWLENHSGRKVELTIVGDGRHRPEVQAAQGSHPRLQIGLTGNVAYRDLPSQYGAHGIFVLPTLADEWGVVVNEAMAAGLPVLGSIHSQAVLEMVEPGVTGWAFDPSEPADVARAVDEALSASPKDLDAMRGVCRERSARYAPEVLLKSLMDGLTGRRQAKSER